MSSKHGDEGLGAPDTAAHEDVLRWLSRSLDGELSDREQILLADHVDGCPRCAQVALEWRRVHAVLRRDALAAQRRAPVGLDERILARIADAANGVVEVGGAAESLAAPVDGEAARDERGRQAMPPLQWMRRSAAIAAGLLVLLGVSWVASGPEQASAAARPSALEQADPALRRVLERWQRGRSAPPSFFELVLTESR